MTYLDFMEEWAGPADYCVVHTSGSTGTPKEIHLAKALMVMSALRTLRFFGIAAGSRLHSCISPDFIGGKMMAVRAIAGGMHLTWETPSNRPEIAGEVFTPASKPAMVAVVPSQMLHILDSGDPERFDGIIWLIGGQAIDPGLRHRIVASGLEAWESYGMTETASHIALRRVQDPPAPFLPLEGVRISTDGRGCLVIEQPHMQRLATNDMVNIAPSGGFTVTGRADNVIITGGRKVQPESVESRLQPLLAPLGVKCVMLTSEPDAKWGQRLVLLAETEHEGADRTTVAAIETRARLTLERHEMPKEIRLVSSLPRTPNGKLRRDLS